MSIDPRVSSGTNSVPEGLSSAGKETRPGGAVGSGGDVRSELDQYKEALSLWLRWSDQYQQATRELYVSRRDLAAIEELMDQMDQLLFKAIRLTKELLRE